MNLNRLALVRMDYKEPVQITCERDEVFIHSFEDPRKYRIKKINEINTKYDDIILCDRCEVEHASKLDHCFPEHNDFTLCKQCEQELENMKGPYEQ